MLVDVAQSVTDMRKFQCCKNRADFRSTINVSNDSIPKTDAGLKKKEILLMDFTCMTIFDAFFQQTPLGNRFCSWLLHFGQIMAYVG